MTKILLVYEGITDLQYSKILMIIVQIKYIKKSTNYLKEMEYLLKLDKPKNCKLSKYYFRLKDWLLQTILQT